ncbi:MAG TPA: type II toxin-antitoxin system VapC family toxin [Dehalococcoidia bacterium]|nr:type II toxin-antitoxin system VapC family toxin [Dehalococcoidia bacterium]
MARFLDANVLVYAAGRPHPLRESCQRVVDGIVQVPSDFLTSVEVFQEIIHRYRAIRRWEPEGRRIFWRFIELLQDRVEPIYETDARNSALLAERYGRVQSRDLFHVAVMQRLGVTEIISTDRGFDAITEVTRIDPAAWTPSQ